MGVPDVWPCGPHAHVSFSQPSWFPTCPFSPKYLWLSTVPPRISPGVLGPYSDAGKYRTVKDPSDEPESMWNGTGRL